MTFKHLLKRMLEQVTREGLYKIADAAMEAYKAEEITNEERKILFDLADKLLAAAEAGLI